ncbi:hypothetical protein GCM10022197_00320 [Microlunatus spumicola]|uniref:Uncharacterized protein n=1 Tax=Microlunatus spumicola TaxID=81499 RepID=A0ABP6WB98_9ACTN
MPDDWSWFWAGENGRDNLLRDELEGLQRSASASASQSARLSSQLRTLQGSIESRLQALSTAFDAYVELGDVREQLAAYAGTAAVRREVVAALEALQQGRTPDVVDAGDTGYWLADAANEVVGLAGGGASTSGPPTAGPEHETFVVAALGWLGRGERVAARVPPLLVSDGALAAPQVVLWDAVVHGVYGDVLGDARPPDLDGSAEGWEAFAAGSVDVAGPVATLRRVQQLLDPGWVPPSASDASAPDDRPALRTLVDALVGAGLGDERALLERARVLRARIEDPGAAEPDPRAEPPRTGTSDLVRRALLDPGTSPAARRVLTDWARPGLEAAAAGVAARVAAERPGPTVARTPLGDVEVGTDGADRARLAQLDALAVQQRTTPRARLLVPGVGAGLALVLGLVLLATDVAALGVLLLVLAVVAAGLLVRELLRARNRRTELAEVRRLTRERVEQARAAAVTAEAERTSTAAQVAELARAVQGTGSLHGTASAGGTAVVDRAGSSLR